jgi:hypothetical protein
LHNVSRPHDFERTDADPRLVGLIALGVAVFLVGVPVFVLLSYPDASRLGRLPDILPQPPAPRLQVEPKADLDRLHASENKQLGSYGWVDRDKSIARIPIDRALQLLSERGLAGWPSPTAPSAGQAPQ